MNHSKIASKSQADIQVLDQIDDFFDKFCIGTLLDRCGIRKRHGYSVRSLTKTVFSLPFIGKNFFRGIVINENADVGKDAAYDLLKACTYNWRRFLLIIGARLHRIFDPLTSDQRESVLIIDDSPYDRSRSKKVELLSRVFDHSTGRYLKGFRLMTICWSDGVSCLPLDFALLSSSKEKNRFHESHKSMDKRCCAFRRRKEATTKATALLAPMVNRILKAGINARYVLMDSWFTMPSNVCALRKHLDVIGMVKKTPKVCYEHDGKKRNLMEIYQNLTKRRGRAKILASTTVKLGDGKMAKIVFVRDRRKKDWLALLSTDIDLPDAEVIRIYGKRWDIEVLFKMAKQHLKLVKEIQCRDFDMLIAHTTIVFMRYMFISYRVRTESDHRSFGDLFYACCQELSDIGFLEALHRIMTLAAEQLRKIGTFCEKTAMVFFDTVIAAALKYVNLSKNRIIANEC
jgi:hypothetical protein